MQQLLNDHAWNALKEFEKAPDKIEEITGLDKVKVKINYQGPDAWIVYTNTKKVNRENMKYIFTKKEVVFK